MKKFSRLPEDYQKLCKLIGEQSVAPKQRPLSPQNRRVRFAADLHLASQKTFPDRMTRQQLRRAAR